MGKLQKHGMQPLFAACEPEAEPADPRMPGGLSERDAEWHFRHIVEFTKFKRLVNEPSPHLAIMGHFCRDAELHERVWRLWCYASVYCLPTAQVMWAHWPLEKVVGDRDGMSKWLVDHWPGIVTRTERRCVRTPKNLDICLRGCLDWIATEFPRLGTIEAASERDYYDAVWDSVLGVKFIGRYIAIRFIEGLRRYCNIPARLYDMRSIGGWSPKKALVYLYRDHADALLTEGAEGSRLADQLCEELIARFAAAGTPTDHYVMAAMLCEYREAFEDHHQYPGWTIDQEPLLFDKVAKYWGADVATTALWEARDALFPHCALGEKSGWNGTRWPLTKTLRDHGYNWSDTLYDYAATTDMKQPVRRSA